MNTKTFKNSLKTSFTNAILLTHKKNPAPAGDDDGRIMPAFNEKLMYSSMAALSRTEME